MDAGRLVASQGQPEGVGCPFGDMVSFASSVQSRLSCPSRLRDGRRIEILQDYAGDWDLRRLVGRVLLLRGR